jgi:hypothetical protein
MQQIQRSIRLANPVKARSMKKLVVALVFSASAALVQADLYNQSITAIYGGGNPDTGWAADSGNGLTLGLRAKNRDTGDTPNTNGVYTFATGFNATNNRAVWNYEFSINSGKAMLSSYDYYLGVDMDPSQAISYTFFNPLAVFTDNSYGLSTTLNGQGAEGSDATNSSLGLTNSIVQNSENIVFLGLDPTLNATYNYELFAVAKGAGVDGAKLDDVAITVVVGSGGSQVPDSGSSALLLALGVAGLAGFKLRRRKA